ncbi:MAG TPA: prenyltransferase [Candidatus Lustribacter sp.]|nr:prenyltransferase [Candidatus Lustribacter sp.]
MGGFAGFGLGAAVARFDGYALDWRAYLLGQLVVTAFHLMVHFANDYFDQATDALGTPARWSGGSGVLARGELAPRVALVAAQVCAAIGVAATLVEVVVGNWWLVVVGVAIGVLAWVYSAPPVRLLARGLGELDAIAVVALLVPLAGYVTFARGAGAHVLVAVLPGICAMFAMMLAVEIPDVGADTATGKRNLVVRWGVASAAVAARTFASSAVLLLLWIGSVSFASPPAAFLGILPAAIVAAAFAAPQFVAHLPFATFPFLGVALYGLTTCAGIVLVVGATS